MTLERGNIRQRVLATTSLFLLAFVLFATAASAADQGAERRRPARLAYCADRNGFHEPRPALKADDAAWNHNLSSNWGIDGEIFAVTPYEDGVVVAGDFVYADNVLANGIAYFDGTTWSAMGSGVDGEIYAIEVVGGVIYAGGDFSMIDGSPAANLAEWTGTGWSTGLGEVNGPVYDIGSLNGDLAIVGEFSSISGIDCNRLAIRQGNGWFSLNFDGSWTVETIYEDVVETGVEPDIVTTVTLYIGGDQLASWDETNGWAYFDVDGHINSIIRHDVGLLAGGHMSLVGGFPCLNSAVWNGEDWSG